MILDYQKKLVTFSQKFVKNKNYLLSDISYFATYEDSLGIQYLKSKIEKKYIIDILKKYLKQFIGIANSELDFKFNPIRKFNINDIVVSWAFKNNFDNKGNYYDKYLNVKSSKYKKKIWILIYMDKVLPSKIQNNIFLIFRKKNTFKYSLPFFTAYLIQIFVNHFFKRDFLLKLNNSSAFSNELIKILKKNIKIKNLKKVFLVYEGQLFQRELIKFFKYHNSKVRVIGYDQSAPPALPLNLIYDNYSPDILLTSGSSQRSFYNKYLLWPMSKLKIINSMRFKNDKRNFYSEKIFVPFELGNTKVYLNSFKKLIKKENINLSKLEIKNHPRNLNNKKNTNFTNNIKELLKKKYLYKKKQIFTSVFFGQTTAMINALELGIVCYHICSDPKIDSYCSKLWSNIQVTKIDEFLFKYKIKKKKSFINLGKKQYL
jgi:hypothetical protein